MMHFFPPSFDHFPYFFSFLLPPQKKDENEAGGGEAFLEVSPLDLQGGPENSNKKTLYVQIYVAATTNFVTSIATFFSKTPCDYTICVCE